MNCEVRTLGNLHPSDLEILGPRGANCLRRRIFQYTPLGSVLLQCISKSECNTIPRRAFNYGVVTNEGLQSLVVSKTFLKCSPKRKTFKCIIFNSILSCLACLVIPRLVCILQDVWLNFSYYSAQRDYY